MSLRIDVGKNPTMYANLLVYGNRGTDFGVPLISAFGYSTSIEAVCKDLNAKNKDIYFSGRYYSTNPGSAYKTKVSKMSSSDYAHLIAFKKDTVTDIASSNDKRITAYIYWEQVKPYFSRMLSNPTEDIPPQFLKVFYDKMYKMVPDPIIEEWCPYLMRYMAARGMIVQLEVEQTFEPGSDVSTQNHLYAFALNFTERDYRTMISRGLSQGLIQISAGNNNVSDTMRNISGLDSYLASFRDVLAKRIQSSFIPRFRPTEDKYSEILTDLADYDSYMGKLNLFDAQKGVIQATSNALDQKKCAFIIGEQGSGKTAMATVTVMTNNNEKKTMTNIVMCPGHLVEKWKREIERLAPGSDAVIVDSFDRLVELMPRIKDKKRRRHLWLVISKETAKFGYNERPAAVWKSNPDHLDSKTYCCPECGQPLYTVHWEGRGRYRHEVRDYFERDAFNKKSATNSYCMNTVKYFDREAGEWKERKCHAKLWEALGKYKTPCIHNDERESAWVYLGAHTGWLPRNEVENELERISSMTNPKREYAYRLPELSAAVEDMDSIREAPAPIKYPLGKYIRKTLKGYIDYALIDEVHLLKGRDSLQGQAFSDLVSCAKHSLCFTGTLLNGYASSIFYILYRAFPGLMKKEGFDFGGTGEMEFVKQYGVYKSESNYEFSNGHQGNRHGNSKFKQLPGVSPIVFTKFLLENVAFISLEDMAESLPGYTEIPIGVDMDDELMEAYMHLETAIHDSFSSHDRTSRGSIKTLSQMIQSLSIYPDQPYDQPPIVDPDTGNIVVAPEELSHDYRNKEMMLLNIVQEKVDNGEKVLVYYSWPNRTELGEKLPRLFAENDIKAVTLKASVKSSEREAWIKKQVEEENIDVLVVNPSLVDTGLDLLDFTTIVFYQVGYNLFTMRQASRRSWRLSQTKDVEVYYMYYKRTVQEQALSLMATKLQAAMAIEGKFSEEGLNAMSNNEDVLTQIASSVAEGIKDEVDAEVFKKCEKKSSEAVLSAEKERSIDKPINREVTILDTYKEKKRTLKAVSSEEKEYLNLRNAMTLFA